MGKPTADMIDAADVVAMRGACRIVGRVVHCGHKNAVQVYADDTDDEGRPARRCTWSCPKCGFKAHAVHAIGDPEPPYGSTPT